MLQPVLILLTIIFLGVSQIAPLYPAEQYLQHSPTVLAIIFLAVAFRKRWFSALAFFCIVAFFWLHILGARYVYSFVPYDDWSQTLCGVSVSKQFGWERNHYDRLVHFAFGALCILPAREFVEKNSRMSFGWATLFALFTVITLSASYEILEWLLTVAMSPKTAETYNGQQGDFWDAQKDMALACVGAVLVTVVCLVAKRR